MRVYNEPCEMLTDDQGQPRAFIWRGQQYGVIRVLEDWDTMRPWWRLDEQLPDPMDYRVRHYRVEASTSRGHGVVQVRREFEGWFLTGFED